MTFLVLVAIFLGVAVLVALVVRPPVRWSAALVAAAVMFTLTAVFDNVMISAGLFEYGNKQLLGLRIGRAPVEDFGYPLVALVLLPALWHLLRGRR